LKRKGLVLCLVCVLLFSMTACTGGGETPQTTPTTTGGDTTTTTTTAPPTGGEETPAETVEVTLGETGFALGDAVFTIGGDPIPLQTALKSAGKALQECYTARNSEEYAGHWFTEYSYYVPEDDSYWGDYTDSVCTVTAAETAAQRLVRWYTTDERYRFKGISVGSSASDLLAQWGDEKEEQQEEGTKYFKGSRFNTAAKWVYPYNACYNVVFYVRKSEQVVEIGIEAAELTVDAPAATPIKTPQLSIVANDEEFTVNGLPLTDGCEAAPLLAMLGTPLAVHADGYTDTAPSSWLTTYTYDDCVVETWAPKDSSDPETFYRLLMTGKRHTLNRVSVGDEGRDAYARMSQQFAVEPTWMANRINYPPFGVFYRFESETGMRAECAFDQLKDEDGNLIGGQDDYNDRPVTMLVVGASIPKK